nr:hypothetical protein [Tanacetum cinerariifolium]
MVNVIPPDHVDDVPVIEPNQHDDVPVVPEPVLVDKDEDPVEEEFKEEEDPQEEEEEDDIEVDIEEDENEPELTYPYEEMDPLNPPPPASGSEPKDVTKAENLIEHEDETVLASVHEVGEFPQKDGDSLLPDFMRRGIDSLFDLGNEVRSSVEQGTTTMEKLVEKLGNAEDKAECKNLQKELEEARLRNTFLRMQNERVKRDLYWTRVRAYEFYQEMIHRGFMFEERPNEAIDVPIEEEKSPSSELRGSPHDAYCYSLNDQGKCRCCYRWCELNVRNDANGSRPVRGQDTAPAIQGKKVKFAAATLQVPALTWWNSKVDTMGLKTVNQMHWTEMKQLMIAEFCPIEEVQIMEHELWNLKVKEYNIVSYTQRFNELALMCVRMVEPERVKVDAYIRGLTDNIKSEVTSSKPANLNEAVHMAHNGKSNHKDNSRQTTQNDQKQGNAQAMVIAHTDGKVSSGSLPLGERCFTSHVGLCTIKCHKGGKIGHKARYCNEKNVATGANTLSILTGYDCGEQGHTRNRCPKKVKQEEVGEVHGRAYAIKDAEPKGPKVVTGASYEVELADGRVVSTNTDV